MRGIHFLTREIGYESGVVVSLRHLCRELDKERIPYRWDSYKDDQELIMKAMASPFDTLNLHVPSFSDETLKYILTLGKEVFISIHSTLCNLQVEGDSLNRLLTLGNSNLKHLRFTCPSESETEGFNAVTKNRYLYLPNTFSYQLDKDLLEEQMTMRKKLLEENKNDMYPEPVRISLISAYRPMKNMITQMAAITMLAKKRPVELHLVDSNLKTPVYYNLLMMAKTANIPVILYPQMKNEKLVHALYNVHLGMQVSLSETFSYVAMEHMIQGIPMIGSASVPYASIQADYSDVRNMYQSMKRILDNPKYYEQYQRDARRKALQVAEKNRQEAIDTIRKMIKG